MTGFTFDPGEIEIEEIEILEKHGVDFGLFQDVAATGQMPTGAGNGLMMRALVFLVKRREDETYTWKQAGKMKLNEMSDLLDSVGDLADAGEPLHAA